MVYGTLVEFYCEHLKQRLFITSVLSNASSKSYVQGKWYKNTVDKLWQFTWKLLTDRQTGKHSSEG
jgi:hypothetical protein